MKTLIILLSFLFGIYDCIAQPFSILIREGHVIDPKNNIDEVADIAISDGKIVRIAKHIDGSAIQVVNAKGLYVTPGLIDLHAHVFAGTQLNHYLSDGPDAVQPDGFTFRAGVTTVVDAGGAGWKSFPVFKTNIIERSKTRVLCMLNVIGEGMRGGVYEQDAADMNPKMIAMTAKANRNIIVGIKVAHYQGPDWRAVDSAVSAGRLAGIPVMIDFGGSMPALSIEALFMQHLRPGDIFTHVYGNLSPTREPIVDESTNKVKTFVWEARKRGILFDVGFGGISFKYSQAIPAIMEGFFPNTISTDLHSGSMNNAMKDQLNVMSAFLAMGMQFPDVIKASTVAPAQAIKHEELGNLSVGSVADLAILNLREGIFGFYDYTGFKIEGKKKLECAMTIRDGKIVYDLNGIATPVYPPSSNKENGIK